MKMEISGGTYTKKYDYRMNLHRKGERDERPGKLNILGAIAIVDGFEIELIQPIGEGVYADWLRQHGPGVHHKNGSSIIGRVVF